MTGYDRSWDCRVCGDHQTSVCWPRVFVCDKCLRPLANRICREVLKTNLGPGIDESYFTNRAYDYAEALLGRSQKPVNQKGAEYGYEQS